MLRADAERLGNPRRDLRPGPHRPRRRRGRRAGRRSAWTGCSWCRPGIRGRSGARSWPHPEQRFAMVELACAGLDGVEVSRVEIDARRAVGDRRHPRAPRRPPGGSCAAARGRRGGEHADLAPARGDPGPGRRSRSSSGRASTRRRPGRAGGSSTSRSPAWTSRRRRSGAGSALGLPIDGLTPPPVVQFIRDEGLYTLALMAQGVGGTVLDEPDRPTRRERRRSAAARSTVAARGGRAEPIGTGDRARARPAGSGRSGRRFWFVLMPAVAVVLAVVGRDRRADPCR